MRPPDENAFMVVVVHPLGAGTDLFDRLGSTAEQVAEDFAEDAQPGEVIHVVPTRAIYTLRMRAEEAPAEELATPDGQTADGGDGRGAP